ncbi:methionyl-tRNA formyltransferase [Schaalia vaccimaxillae]|uniref:methionyl-tRNA formyltransferase n=1 Tax=Schaalia vaccimaxillae TaxID=183916 RepID=UPI0003B70A4F|nr:methionyl-tRNA formyltransferase [Schaalia vaccimaxillae]
MRILFAGTPQAAVPTLKALIGSDHDVVAVLTRPPARSGRGRSLHPSPVAQVATEHGIELIETSTLKTPQVKTRVEETNPDLAVVVAYGALVPADVLSLPTHGWINLHFSDLPRWRGAAPVQWAILAGDTTTASCVFQLEEGLDTGPVFSRQRLEIGHETSGELLERMSTMGADQVLEVVDKIAKDGATAIPQTPLDEETPHARMLRPADGFITFTETAVQTDQRIRAVSPNPGAYTTLPDGRRLKLANCQACPEPQLAPGQVHATKTDVYVGCSDGSLRLGRVAPAGKGWMDGAAWARGARLEVGAVLGQPQEN